jgi:hypothetical protein
MAQTKGRKLSPEEAADLLGFSERKLRRMRKRAPYSGPPYHRDPETGRPIWYWEAEVEAWRETVMRVEA